MMSFAGSTLAKVSFLCTVLLEEPETRHLAFRIGLYGMEMTRPPAVSKSLEVCCDDVLLLYSTTAVLLLYFTDVNFTCHREVWLT